MALDLAYTVQQAITTVGNAVEGVVKTATYGSYSGAPAYDPVTGAVGTPYQTTNSIRVIVTEPEKRLEDGSVVRPEGVVIIIAKNDLGGIVPKQQDQVTVDGVTYNVKNVRRDPAGASFYLEAVA